MRALADMFLQQDSGQDKGVEFANIAACQSTEETRSRSAKPPQLETGKINSFLMTDSLKFTDLDSPFLWHRQSPILSVTA